MVNHILITKTIKKEFIGEPELKWCFGCRKKLQHRRVLLWFDNPYYDPEYRFECPNCKTDSTDFPGVVYG
jgi:hypothetical protein